MKKYRKIPSLNLLYEISKDGELRNVKSKKILKGYLWKSRRCYGISNSTIYQHRLIYEVWGKEKLIDGYHIHHIDFDKTNNHISNLMQLSPSDHSILHMESLTKEELEEHMSIMRSKVTREIYKQNGDKKSIKVYTMHNNKELQFKNSWKAAEWVISTYPNKYSGKVGNMAGAIRRTCRGDYKGILYKHKWYRKLD